MVADEKGVVRRDDIRIEDGEWRFQLWRPARQPDHRTLLRIFDERPFPVLERQHCRGRKGAQGRGCHSGTERCDGSPGMLYEAAPIDHSISAFPSLAAGRTPQLSRPSVLLVYLRRLADSATDTCVRAEARVTANILRREILASLTCRRLFRLRLGENFHEF